MHRSFATPPVFWSLRMWLASALMACCRCAVFPPRALSSSLMFGRTTCVQMPHASLQLLFFAVVSLLMSTPLLLFLTGVHARSSLVLTAVFRCVALMPFGRHGHASPLALMSLLPVLHRLFALLC
ncbi:hypothetical protein TRVL_06732 [Trypanosoma vivax]|nr:hypothetical protein TRVL_06732 [Trypanosoma vivax]